MKKLSIFHQSKGITLVELLVYIAISTVVTLSILTFVVSLIKAQNKVSMERETWESSQRAIDQITRELQKATVINEGSSTFGVNPGVLDFETFSYDSDDIINMRFYESNNRIYIQTSTYNDALTSSEVEITNFTFDLYTSGNGIQNVKISITAEKNKNILGSSYNAETTLERSVTLRN